MCKVAKKVIVVTDSSKFNRCGVHKICGINEIDTLVTDNGIPDTFAQSLEQKGVNLVIVSR
jgi:DeoR family transcriptional regulator of aga operon